MEISQIDYQNIIFIGLLIPLILGIVLGWTNKIVVFRNYEDLGLTFLSFLVPIFAYFLYSALGESQITAYFFIFVEIVLLSYLFFRSFIDNQKNIFSTILAIYTKFPLSFLYLVNLFNAINSLFNKEKKYKSPISIFLFVILTSIMVKLVKERKGFFG